MTVLVIGFGEILNSTDVVMHVDEWWRLNQPIWKNISQIGLFPQVGMIFFFRNHYLALENPRSLASFPFPPACYVGPSLGKMVGTIFPDDKTSNQHILCGVAGFFSNKNPFSKSPVRLLCFCSFFFQLMKTLMCQDTSLNSVETPLAPAHVIVDPPKRCAQTCLGAHLHPWFKMAKFWHSLWLLNLELLRNRGSLGCCRPLSLSRGLL